MFADKLKQLRNSRTGLTQAKLAEQLGVSQQAVGLWERGKNMPSHELVVQIAKLFGVPTDYLVGGLLGNISDPSHPWNKHISQQAKSDVAWNPPPNYYNDPETQRRMEEMYSDPKRMRIFVASKDLKPEELDRIADLMETIAKSHRKD